MSKGLKTIKLRTSQSFRPQSADQNSGIIPFQISEQAYLTSLKMDLMNLEDEISKLNKLGLQPNKLSVQHDLQIKQWISNIKINDRCIDAQRVIQICNCTDAHETVIKLYNMIQHLDYFVNKVTELQCLHFLQYEQCLHNFQSNYLQKIASQSIQPNRFIMSLLNLEIIEHLVQRKDGNNVQSSYKLNDLKEENIKLHTQIVNLQNQCKKLQDQLSNSTMSQSQLSQLTIDVPSNPTSYYIKVIDEVKDGYQNLISMLREENLQLGLKLSDTQQKYSTATHEIVELNKKLDNLKQEKDDLYKRFIQKYKTNEEFEKSYEAALKDEYSSMEITFKQRLQQLNQQIEQNNREYNKKILEQKQTIDQYTDRERMLIKKLSLYQKL